MLLIMTAQYDTTLRRRSQTARKESIEVDWIVPSGQELYAIPQPAKSHRPALTLFEGADELA